MTQILSALVALGLLAGVAAFTRHSGDRVSFVETPVAASSAT